MVGPRQQSIKYKIYLETSYLHCLLSILMFDLERTPPLNEHTRHKSGLSYILFVHFPSSFFHIGASFIFLQSVKNVYPHNCHETSLHNIIRGLTYDIWKMQNMKFMQRHQVGIMPGVAMNDLRPFVALFVRQFIFYWLLQFPYNLYERGRFSYESYEK